MKKMGFEHSNFPHSLTSRHIVTSRVTSVAFFRTRRTSAAPKRGTKARLSFSGGPHAPVNLADNMEEVNVGGKKHRKWRVCCAVLRFILTQVFANPWILWVFHRLFRSRNSRITGILHTFRHVYRSVWPAREAKPRFSVALERSAHDCET